jgi:uncharacterized protein
VPRSNGAGSWRVDAEAEGDVDLPAPGGDPAALAGALDCDMGLSPVTNVMPILRHGLLSWAGQAELTAAWVSVPDLGVRPDRQRYAAVGPNLVRYDALDCSFSATITVDDDGLVTDYPGIARRVQAREQVARPGATLPSNAGPRSRHEGGSVPNVPGLRPDGEGAVRVEEVQEVGVHHK